MPMGLLVVALLSSEETVVLKESARVSGRYVRLADLLETDPPASLAAVYLGRAPEEHETRVITLEEIRRELDRRGVDPELYTFVGKRVEIAPGEEALTRTLRAQIVREICRCLMTKPSEEVAVQLLKITPQPLPSEAQVSGARSLGEGEFALLLVDGENRKIDVRAQVRVARLREASFAARDIASGRILERGDLEIRRVEVSPNEPSGDVCSPIGAQSAGPIRKGAKIEATDLRPRAPVKRGDVVRAVSSSYEVDARALEEGRPGQVIALEFLASRNRLHARVSGADRVEVVEEGK